MTCFLCVQHADLSDGKIAFASEEAELLNMKSIIEQHFWLQFKNASAAMSFVCVECWNHVIEFHNFYTKVEQAHKALALSEINSFDPIDTSDITQNTPQTVNKKDIKNENVNCDSVAAAVKRRRGRPRLKPVADITTLDDNAELKAVLEQINLNEIKIEFPEADLTIADVLEDQCETAETEYLSNSYFESEISEEAVCKPKKGKRKTAKQSVRKQKTSGVGSVKKSREFNDFIREHFKIHCHACNAPMEDFGQMLTHAREVHNERGYATCCNRKFLKRGVLVDHLRRHQDPDLFKCHICNRVMGQRRSLELHMRMHEIKKQGKLHKCEICQKRFYSSVVYERHKLTHIPKEECQVTCTNCDKKFPTKYTMEQHVRLVHIRKYARMCDVCGKSIRGGREALARHMEDHTGGPQEPVKCELCGSTLTTKYGLARHIKMMHTEENLQPMQCDICFKISPSLQAHQHHTKYTHNTARNHQCPMCEKAFKRPSELREHVTTHTGEVLYTCPHCPKTFNSNANMHAHRKKVHRKEWEEHRQLRCHQLLQNRKRETIIAASVRKTTATATAAGIANPVSGAKPQDLATS